MNEKLQYATMLEIPVSTCSVSSAPVKKKGAGRKKKVNPEEVKEKLLKKINSEQVSEQIESPKDQSGQVLKAQEYQELIGEKVCEEKEQTAEQGEKDNLLDAKPVMDEEKSEQEIDSVEETITEDCTATVSKAEIKKKEKFKFSIISVQLAIIGVLVATIFLTNALFIDSGINVFLRGVFGTETATVDARTFKNFTPVVAMGDNDGVLLNDGIISFAGEGSVYAPCDGKVTSIVKENDGQYTIEITHSKNFKSVLFGVEHVYVELNDTVYRNIPVGFLETGSASMCFKGENGDIIGGYQLVGDTVVWAD